jgi:ribonuclease P protein component
VLVVAMSGGDGPPRVGVVAGRRVGGAVVRNRAKRRLREALARVELRDGATYVVVALPGVASATFEQVLAWVRSGTRPDRKWMEETD